MTVGLLAMLAVAQDTDTTFAAAGARHIEVSNAAGTVQVRTWDRDAVRVRAAHSRRTEIEIRRREDTWRLSTDRGITGGIADYELTVPRGFGVTVDGMYFTLDVEGVGGPVEAQSIEGAMRVVGARGVVELHAINGRITLEDTEGTIKLGGAAERMDLRDVGGDVTIESIGGDVQMTEMSASKVDVSSVGGDIRYSGTLADAGEYVFTSHGGSVTVAVPEGTNADVWAASVMGEIDIGLTGADERAERGRRQFTLGRGGADLEIETFGGRITIRPLGEGGR